MSAILSILECIPAPTSVSARVFDAYRAPAFDHISPDGRDIKRQALLALALSPPPQPEARLEEFFIQAMADPPYAVAAFAGLRRLSLVQAIDEVPRLLRVLRAGDLRPRQALWSLFRELEPEPHLAHRLTTLTGKDPELASDLKRIVRDELDAPRRFPRAWAAFQQNDANGVDDDRSYHGYSPLAELDPGAEEAIDHANESSRSEPAGLLKPAA